MDHSPVVESRTRWLGRLQVQLWLWFILPMLLALVALALAGAYNSQEAIRKLASERNVDMARLYARQISNGLETGAILLNGQGLEPLIQNGRIGERGVVYVVDGTGQVLFHPTLAYQGARLDWDPAVERALASDTGTASGRFADGSPTLASFALVPNARWRVLVEEPVPQAVTSLLRTSSTLPILLVAAGFLSLLLIDFLLHTVVQPLRNLAQAATLITWGDWPNLDQDVGGVEEIRHLQHALSDLMKRIQGYEEGMRDYVDAVTQGQETERARLSRELHDQTAQDLIAAGQRLQLAQRALDRGDIRATSETLHKAHELVQGTLDELRRLIRALRPVYLDDLGFLPALEALVRETQAAALSTEIRVQGQVRRLAPATELAAFRVAQEALTNAVQHAQASQVLLNVTFGEQELKLSVEDDGAGFVMPGTPDVLVRTGHMGLVGMRERVLLAGGKLDIQSKQGQGTSITARFPV